MNSSNNLLNILCYVQRGMLGYVTPNLRALYVVVENDTTIELVLYYDNPPSEEEEELASLIDTYVSADLPPPVYDSSYTVKVFPYPKKIPDIGYCVYKRYEKD